MRRWRRKRKNRRLFWVIFVLAILVGIFQIHDRDSVSTSYSERANIQFESEERTAPSIENVRELPSADENRTIYGLPIWLFAIIAIIILFDIFLLHCILYFRGKKFKRIKRATSAYIKDCNELNDHIEELRESYIDIKRIDYGEASFEDLSKYKYKRKQKQDLKYAPNVYDCSRQVCDNARKQPFKYICKYFNIKTDERSLEQFEKILNNFVAAEEGKELLKNKKDDIIYSKAHDIPWYIRKLFDKKLERELGLQEFKFNEMFFPTFSFRYISAGGNAAARYDITLDIEMLERFVTYLADSIEFRNSAEGQRRLMTSKLRRFIITRDNNTCQICGNSTRNEPNLLLEVDHIVPIARGGLTTETNLQTLCWKCNRHKGANLVLN